MYIHIRVIILCIEDKERSRHRRKFLLKVNWSVRTTFNRQLVRSTKPTLVSREEHLDKQQGHVITFAQGFFTPAIESLQTQASFSRFCSR